MLPGPHDLEKHLAAFFFLAKPPLQLCTIDPTARRTGALEATKAAISSASAAGLNVYFHPAEIRPGVAGKAAKADVVRARGLWAEIDVRKAVEAQEGGWTAERARLARLAQALMACSMPPSMLNDSGNGLHIFWWLAEGAELPIEVVERLNKEVLRVLGSAEGTWNIDRLLRVPGTMNWPDAAKQARGRAPRPCRILAGTGKRYTAAELARLPQVLAEEIDPELVPAEAHGGRDARRTESGTVSSARGEALAVRETIQALETAGVLEIGSGTDLPDELRLRLVSAIGQHETLARRWAGDAEGLADGSRSSLDFSLTASLRSAGFGLVEIAQILRAYQHGAAGDEGKHAGGPLRYIARCLVRAGLRAQAAEGDTADDRAVINYDPSRMFEMVEACCAALRGGASAGDVSVGGRGPEVYHFAGGLASVVRRMPVTAREIAEAAAEDRPRQEMVRHYDAASLRVRLTQSVRLRKWDARSKAWVACGLPLELVQSVLGGGPALMPPLTAVVTTPTMREDGSLLTAGGYDQATGIYGSFDPADFPAIPDCPTREDALEALRWLRDEVLVDWPFREEASLSACLAMFLQAIIRPSIGLAPAYVIVAPTQGVGKTTLAVVLGIVCMGRPPGVVTFSADAVEMEKVVLSVLLEGAPMVLFDNLKLGALVDSVPLAKMLSAETYSGRVLGANRQAHASTAGTVVLTGNNITMSGDLASRVVEIYLEQTTERPSARAFRHVDVCRWFAQHRPRIVASLLTIARAHRVAGVPVDLEASRFPSWDASVRAPLVWLGLADPILKLDCNAQADEGAQVLGTCLEAWSECLGDRWVRAADLAALAGGAVLPDMAVPGDALRKALLDLVAAHAHNVKDVTHSVGIALRACKGRLRGGRVLQGRVFSARGEWRVSCSG